MSGHYLCAFSKPSIRRRVWGHSTLVEVWMYIHVEFILAVHLCTQDGGLCVFTDVRDGPRIPIWNQYIQIVAKGRPTVKGVKKRTLCKSTTAISPNMVSTNDTLYVHCTQSTSVH